MPNPEERFVGGLVGLACGDGLGAFFEGQAPESVADRYEGPGDLVAHPPGERLQYTDDTQMAIAVAETLVARGEIDHRTLCEAFATHFEPWRGYGMGARAVLNAYANGDFERGEEIAGSYFPGGSYGNGAAMRVAPVGLFFRNDPDRLWDEARKSALPTHVHPLGIEGAQLLALAVSFAWADTPLDRTAFFDRLLKRAEADVYREKLEQGANAETRQDLLALGNGIEATESVPTAIACFALHAGSYERTIGTAILLGGDTDTIGAMAGALAGTHLGSRALPQRLVGALENVNRIVSLAEELNHKI